MCEVSDPTPTAIFEIFSPYFAILGGIWWDVAGYFAGFRWIWWIWGYGGCWMLDMVDTGYRIPLYIMYR